MIYTDGKHLVSDKDVDELHFFAGRMGINKSWFGYKNKYPYYNLGKPKRRLLMKATIFGVKFDIDVVKKLEKEA